MSLVALDGTPLIAVGIPQRQFFPSITNLSSSTISSANGAVILVGQIFTEDGSAHTIDTTGSSSLGWRAGSVTFADAGTTVKVGLAAVDTSNGPAARAANVSNVITFDVNAAFVGGSGGITGSSWQESVPTTGTKTIANGDTIAFAVQMTSRGGSDSINVSCVTATSFNTGHPTVTTFASSTYTNSGQLPNAVITFSDGVRGYFYGGYVMSTNSSQTWNSGSATKEYGNLIQLPFPAKAYGLVIAASILGDADAVLYSDPLGTPVAENTISIDANTIGSSSTAVFAKLFSTPVPMTANTPYAAILKPTSTTSVVLPYKTFGNTAHHKSESGSNGYAISRASGAFTAQNSGLDRFSIGLLLGSFEGGGGATFGVIGS